MYCTFCEKTGEASKLKSKLMLFWRLLSRRSLPKRRSRQSQRLPRAGVAVTGHTSSQQAHVLATCEDMAPARALSAARATTQSQFRHCRRKERPGTSPSWSWSSKTEPSAAPHREAAHGLVPHVAGSVRHRRAFCHEGVPLRLRSRTARKELPSTPKKPAFTVEELRLMLAEAKQSEAQQQS